MAARRVQQLPVPTVTVARTFGLMGECLRFETNDPRLLEAAEVSFGRFAVPDDGRPPLVLRLFTEAIPGSPIQDSATLPPGGSLPVSQVDPPVVFRSAGSVLLISRGSADAATVDVQGGVATGFVAQATAADQAVVRYTFIEAMGLSMLGRGRGYLAIHAASVVRDGVGIVLQGRGGAGKSTLAMACARRGYGILAEDAVFVRAGPSGLELWGMPWTQRLLPDAPRFFPELADLKPRRQPNGESKLQVDLDLAFPGRSVSRARSGPVILVERGTGGPTRLESVDPAEAAAAIEVLWAFDGGWTPEHEATADQLGRGGCHRLHMNGSPDEAVDALDDLIVIRPGPITLE